MATGDQNDMVGRFQRAFPRNWSGDANSTPIFTALWNGLANALSWSYSQIQYLILQTRIKTATDIWLDIIALDYFGTGLQRYSGETDTAYQARILENLLLPRGTRPALVNAVTLLTGTAPTIIEPWNTGDCGGWDCGNIAWDTAGVWGDLDLPYQLFITAYRPMGEGVANIDGWDGGLGGWDTGAIEWVDDDMISAQVTDAEIYQTIANTMPGGTIAWCQITGPN